MLAGRKIQGQMETTMGGVLLVAAGLDTKPDKQKVALLSHIAKKLTTDTCVYIYNMFTFTAAKEGMHASVLHKLNEYCNPKTNETYERFIFYRQSTARGGTVE